MVVAFTGAEDVFQSFAHFIDIPLRLGEHGIVEIGFAEHAATGHLQIAQFRPQITRLVLKHTKNLFGGNGAHVMADEHLPPDAGISTAAAHLPCVGFDSGPAPFKQLTGLLFCWTSQFGVKHHGQIIDILVFGSQELSPRQLPLASPGEDLAEGGQKQPLFFVACQIYPLSGGCGRRLNIPL